MGLLKRLTALKSANGSSDTHELRIVASNENITYHQDGYETSKSCLGNAHILQASLEALYHGFENKCKEDLYNQSKLKQPYITELKGKQTTLLNKKDELEKLEKDKTEDEKCIEKLHQDTITVKRHPEQYNLEVDKKASAKFWVGLSFLMPLSFYIFIFYVSTSYSAFFRDYTPGATLFGTMFYPQALSDAYAESLLELGFIIFIPFVFFSLGYLIHMFQHKKNITNYIKMTALFIVNFIFDFLLAFLIDEKIYNLTKPLGGPEFSLEFAINSPGFWIIIFAGFVSYIIWGLVFDFVMIEYAERDKIFSFIKDRKEEIFNKEKSVVRIKSKIENLELEKGKIKARIAELQNIIDGFILPIRNYKKLSAEYLKGWLEYIASKLIMEQNEKNALLIECKTAYEKHITALELDTDDYQNKVYTKTL